MSIIFPCLKIKGMKTDSKYTQQIRIIMRQSLFGFRYIESEYPMHKKSIKDPQKIKSFEAEDLIWHGS